MKRPQERFDGVHDRVRQPELAPKGSRYLLEHGFTENKLMTREDQTEEVGAEPSGSKGTYEDVGIEEDPQEIALKTSSSVR